MNTDVGHWDRLPSGEIEIEQLAGFEVAAGPRTVLLRLEIVVGIGQIGTAQLSLPPEEAILLAEYLTERARRVQSDQT